MRKVVLAAANKTLKKHDEHGNPVMPNRKRAQKSTIQFYDESLKYKGFEVYVVPSGSRFKWYVQSHNRLLSEGFSDTVQDGFKHGKHYIDED